MLAKLHFLDFLESVFMRIKETGRGWRSSNAGIHSPDWHVTPPGITPKPPADISNANAVKCEETLIIHQNNLTSPPTDQPKNYSPSTYSGIPVRIRVQIGMDVSSIEVCA